MIAFNSDGFGKGSRDALYWTILLVAEGRM